MKTYVAQPLYSSSCGAYSIAYYLWETNKSKCENDRDFVNSIYENIKLGANEFGLNKEYSDPTKMIKELNENFHCNSYLCQLKDSLLIIPGYKTNRTDSDMDIINKLKSHSDKYAILICSLNNSPECLHYILIKYENETFKMIDPLGSKDDIYNTSWQNFNFTSDNKIIIGTDEVYQYVGTGIFIE